VAWLEAGSGPPLVLAGAEDRLTPLAYGRFLVETIPGARLVEIPAAGHFPQLEQLHTVNAAIRELLACLSGPPTVADARQLPEHRR
jgi:pimeloyl-ACP methyl ester carboxylesterase